MRQSNFQSTLLDRNHYGALLVSDILLLDNLVTRILGIFNKAYYSDRRLRMPKGDTYNENADKGKPGIDARNDGDLDDSGKQLWPKEITDFSTTQMSFEFHLTWVIADQHGISFKTFFDYINADQELVEDYSYTEFGARIVYEFGFPDLTRIRNRIRYGIFGLF